MSTTFKGFGISHAGTSPFGFGDVATADANVGNTLLKTDGSQGDASMISPITRDYVFDKFGRKVGIDAVQQSVYLALITVKDTSAVFGLGSTFQNIKTITPNLNAQVTIAVNDALSALIAAKKVLVQSVSVTITPTKAAQITVNWVDLTKSTNNTTSI